MTLLENVTMCECHSMQKTSCKQVWCISTSVRGVEITPIAHLPPFKQNIIYFGGGNSAVLDFVFVHILLMTLVWYWIDDTLLLYINMFYFVWLVRLTLSIKATWLDLTYRHGDRAASLVDSDLPKSPASRGRLLHFGAICRSPASLLKSPASLALNLVSWFSTG